MAIHVVHGYPLYRTKVLKCNDNTLKKIDTINNYDTLTFDVYYHSKP